MTIFPDGRAIIKGTDDPGLARSLYARYIGQ
jgi:adenylyltransferase/sulfurtransferase